MFNPLKWHRSLLISIAGVIVIIGFLIGTEIAGTHVEQAKVRTERTPSAENLDVLLRRIGFDPESLCAAGVSADQVAPLIEAVVDAIVDDGRSVAVLGELNSNMTRRMQSLGRKVRSGTASPEEITEYQQSIRDRNRSDNLQGDYYQRIILAGQVTLNPEQVDTLQILHENALWNVPVEFRVVRRTENEWLRLRDALVVERQSNESGEPMSPKIIATIASARASRKVRKAIDRLSEQHVKKIQKEFQDTIQSVGK